MYQFSLPITFYKLEVSLAYISIHLVFQMTYKYFKFKMSHMKVKTTDEKVKVIEYLQAGPSMMWFFYACCRGSMRRFLKFPAWLAKNDLSRSIDIFFTC